MATWGRAFALNDNTGAPYFSGSAELLTLTSGQTALRSYWAFSAWMQYGSVSSYPIGTCMMRAGLRWYPAGGSPSGPLSDPTGDWMDTESVWPQVQPTESTNIDFWLQFNVGNPDKSVKAMRKNTGATDQSLYVCWDITAGADADASFAVQGWVCNLDCLIASP